MEVVPSRAVAVTVVPGTTYFSPLSCWFRDGYFGETTIVAPHLWWRMLVGGVSGDVKVRPRGLLCYGSSVVADMGFSGEILVGSTDTDTMPPLCGIIPS